MRILAFSINPLFPDKVSGGASKHLENLAAYLARQGHEVSVLCTQPQTGPMEFAARDGYLVKAVLPFHQPFPQPYAIAPGDLADIYRSLSAAIEQTDRFYIHDGELLMPRGFSPVPVISSFRDNFYPESVLGSFLSQADEIIAVSPYSAAVLAASAGSFLEGFRSRLHQFNNGLDSDFYKPSESLDLSAKLLKGHAQAWPILLHPHRAEPGKGLEETIKLARRLLQDPGFKDLRVLLPSGMCVMQGETETDFLNACRRTIAEAGLEEHFLFHPWLSVEETPAYYSLGDLTICLGTVPEAFGNVAYESLLCGTPSLVYRIGTHRSQLPDRFLLKASPLDIEGAAQLAANALKAKKRVSEAERAGIAAYFDAQTQLDGYARVITGAEKREPLTFMEPNKAASLPLGLAPWCTIEGKRVYHDYDARWYSAEDLPGLDKLISELDQDGFVRSSASAAGFLRMGILAPMPEL